MYKQLTLAPIIEDAGSKWLDSPVRFFEGSLNDISGHIPAFERHEFSLPDSQGRSFRPHAKLDTVVRLPVEGDCTCVPVGVVSKDYTLVQHTRVVEVASKALKEADISPDAVKCMLEITEYGERMALSLFLPEKYRFDPGDGHSMALRLECTNSVDGSTRFRALMGWYRFVCSNGLIIGVTRTDMRRRHSGNLDLSDMSKVLSSGIAESEKEIARFREWRKRPVSLERIAAWADEDVRKGWGFKAATRAYHIACTGTDIAIAGQYKDNKPTTIPIRRGRVVPGTAERCSNLYDVSQTLAWLAKERRDVQEQLEWREQIPELMKPLMN